MKALLMRAYELKEYQLSAPAWADSTRYEIAAKVPAGATRYDLVRMLQALLAERFGLAVHRESRDLPVYALVVGKGGSKLKANAGGASEDGAEAVPLSPRFTKGADGLPEMAAGQSLPRTYEAVTGGSDGLVYKFWARQETMKHFADRLSAQLSRPVLDETGLTAAYDFVLTWSVENGGTGVPRTGPPPDMIEMHNSPILPEGAPAIFSALPEQLGLKLEARRAPVEILVVDKVEKVPTGN